MRRLSRMIPALAGAALIISACGQPVTDLPEPTTSTTESNLGGDGIPVKIPGEDYQHVARPLTGTLGLEANGCWMIDLGDGPRLLIFPEGFDKPPNDGALMEGPTGGRFADAMTVDLDGGFAQADALPGGTDGFWGGYVGFCSPERRDVVIADSMTAAFDPGGLTESDLVGLARTSVLTRSWGCGFGFEVSSADQRVSVRLYPNRMTPSPPPATLPDENWTAEVLVGKHLNSNHCDDAVEGWEPEPNIVAKWPLTSGQLEFDLPEEVECGLVPPVMARLEGAAFQAGAEEVMLGELAIVNESFGCFAG